MDKDFLIKLTTNLYRLTLLFPKKEPLRYKMRELADDILAGCSLQNTETGSLKTCEDLESLDIFFEVAKNQNWVSPADVLNIQEEYSKINGRLKELQPQLGPQFYEVEPRKIEDENLQKDGQEQQEWNREQEQQENVLSFNPLVARQEKILDFLKEHGRAQVWEAQKVFPEVTKRTLRRDFENLLNQDLIERIGERNETFYRLKILRT